MPSIFETFLDSIAGIVRDIDASLAAGSIANARRGVEENRRRDELASAARATEWRASGDPIAV